MTQQEPTPPAQPQPAAQQSLGQSSIVRVGLIFFGAFMIFWLMLELEKPKPASKPDIKATVVEQWKRYDGLPDDQKTAEALGGVFRSIKTELLKEPDQAAVADAVNENESQFRSRAAKRVRPESYSKGYRNVTLVPSNDPAQCMTWGSMWANDTQMVANMRGMGFQFIECRDKTWTLH